MKTLKALALRCLARMPVDTGQDIQIAFIPTKGLRLSVLETDKNIVALNITKQVASAGYRVTYQDGLETNQESHINPWAAISLWMTEHWSEGEANVSYN